MTVRSWVGMVVGSLMFFAGLAGAYLSHRGLIAKGEPRTVLQVGWAAIYCCSQ